MAGEDRDAEVVVADERGRLFVAVQWDRAEALRQHLLGRGLRPLLHLDPTCWRARVELDADHPAVEVAVREWVEASSGGGA
jgi:hypothetical protein